MYPFFITFFLALFLYLFGTSTYSLSQAHPKISEICENGWSSYIELYNPTTNDIPLSNYAVQFFYDGKTSGTTPFALTGTITPGSFYLISRRFQEFVNFFDREPDCFTSTVGAIREGWVATLRNQEEVIDSFSTISNNFNFPKSDTLYNRIGEYGALATSWIQSSKPTPGEWNEIGIYALPTNEISYLFKPLPRKIIFPASLQTPLLTFSLTTREESWNLKELTLCAEPLSNESFQQPFVEAQLYKDNNSNGKLDQGDHFLTTLFREDNHFSPHFLDTLLSENSTHHFLITGTTSSHPPLGQEVRCFLLSNSLIVSNNSSKITRSFPHRKSLHRNQFCTEAFLARSLFITEVCKTSPSYASYFELYNRGESDIQLSNFTVEIYYSSNSLKNETVDAKVKLKGTLPPYHFHTVARRSNEFNSKYKFLPDNQFSFLLNEGTIILLRYKESICADVFGSTTWGGLPIDKMCYERISFETSGSNVLGNFAILEHTHGTPGTYNTKGVPLWNSHCTITHGTNNSLYRHGFSQSLLSLVFENENRSDNIIKFISTSAPFTYMALEQETGERHLMHSENFTDWSLDIPLVVKKKYTLFGIPARSCSPHSNLVIQLGPFETSEGRGGIYLQGNGATMGTTYQRAFSIQTKAPILSQVQIVSDFDQTKVISNQFRESFTLSFEINSELDGVGDIFLYTPFSNEKPLTILRKGEENIVRTSSLFFSEKIEPGNRLCKLLCFDEANLKYFSTNIEVIIEGHSPPLFTKLTQVNEQNYSLPHTTLTFFIEGVPPLGYEITNLYIEVMRSDSDISSFQGNFSINDFGNSNYQYKSSPLLYSINTPNIAVGKWDSYLTLRANNGGFFREKRSIDIVEHKGPILSYETEIYAKPGSLLQPHLKISTANGSHLSGLNWKILNSTTEAPIVFYTNHFPNEFLLPNVECKIEMSVIARDSFGALSVPAPFIIIVQNDSLEIKSESLSMTTVDIFLTSPHTLLFTEIEPNSTLTLFNAMGKNLGTLEKGYPKGWKIPKGIPTGYYLALIEEGENSLWKSIVLLK